MPSFRSDDPALARLPLTAVPRGSAVAEVARQLTEFLASGEFPPGSRLPPERQLAESLGVGRSAVREALAALEILGLVTVRPGSGTYIRDSMSELLPTTLSWGLMLAGDHTAQLSEVRSALEVQAASLAAQRITDEDLELLRGHVEAMEDDLDDLEAFVAADAMFHGLIGRSTGNDALGDLLQTIRSLLRVWVERHLRDREQAEVASREHRAVFEAIAARDPDAAERAMRAHMRTAGERIEHAPDDVIRR
ncbi:FadR family transcriptional regulator [Paenibacillus sp. TRM 82003]|uniref:FadR/GntR family transcriptional regulator n=1 Tax=Kineococcus sp. TRM81007 TaxID=2925831 RepID=UPI001F576E68|nr:FadR/GntR family transcriptional regulator [Kineococcus sp. TRM81007]MCI2237156.1 FadR family transcriptional regulator [Kineococcus sp. TRM81007]MCI3925277.1 FadR family transcriptional regulator [Paenibacillus sp. TRM 82003]